MKNNIFRCITLLPVFFLITLSAKAQLNDSSRFYYPAFEAANANHLVFHVANVNFVKNNEYESRFAPGYTLMGYGLQPTLMYYAGERLRVRAGIYLQQYSGLDYYSKARPLFSARVRLSPSVDVITGALRGHIHHELIEPLFEPERQFSRPVENGLQVLVKRPWLWMDTWIDWEQFIQPGDLFPELFTAGLSARPKLLFLDGEPWKVTFPVDVIAFHRGGEVSSYHQRVQTAMNMSGGLEIKRSAIGIVKEAGLFGYAMNYRNINEVGPLGVNDGHAWYAGAKANTSRTSWMAGYFNGYDFVAPRGSALFQSVSPVYKEVHVPRRVLLTSKIGYNRTFMKRIKFSFLLESYYDVRDDKLDFATLVQLTFDPSFLIAEMKFF